MIGIDLLTFDLTDCSLAEQSENHRVWINSANVAHRLLFNAGPPDWPFDLTKPDEATEFYRKQSVEIGGQMLAMEVVTAARAECLRGLFKYRFPVPGSLAMCYVGILWFPFQECLIQVNVESVEMGTTGAREAAVMLIEGDRWPSPPPETPRVVIESIEDLYAQLGSAPIQQLPSDDEKYDDSFPDHPLSKVRKKLAQVSTSAQLDPIAKRLTPFRVRRG